MSIKQIIEAFRPEAIRKAIRRNRARIAQKRYSHLSTQQVFSEIYRKHIWGKSSDPSQRYYSGSGTHNKKAVSIYVEAVKNFLSAFADKPNVVDLGCGDFCIGSEIRRFCGSYIGCDIVPELMEFDKKKYQHLDVDFRVVDITEDELPKGDVVFLREVFQHLSNDLISEALPKIVGSYKYLVLTEHLPRRGGFRPNLDKTTGDHIRLLIDSGIVLTEPPFNLRAMDERVLCEVLDKRGVIRTTAFTLS